MKTRVKQESVTQPHLFSNQDLKKLLIPVIAEQLLNSLMGMADTVMVSNVGSAAISAVSLVDSINILVIQAFSALAAGGTIVCSHYMGSKNHEQARNAAGQLVLVMALLSTAVTVLGLVFCYPLLRVTFGQVEPLVMENSETYFLITALSFPFIALYNAGSAVFRAQEDTKTPMIISVISNGLNIVGNAILIWVFDMGVAGAALATLASRVFCAAVVLILLRNPKLKISVRDYFSIRPQGHLVGRILALGVPSGIENSMFQFGKLAIQSTISTLGTTAIAAQAMANLMENLNGIAGVGIGIGLMTVVGECMGANRKDEAVYYIKKFCRIGEAAIIASCILVFLITKPVTVLGGMEPESASLCIYMVGWITLVKPFAWVMSFIPGYGMRAAGDVKFSMVVSTITMWVFRVSLCMFLCRVLGFGPMGAWIGMFADWTIRSVIFTWRFKSGKWMHHKVI